MSDYEEEPQMKIGDLKSFSRKVYTVAKVISIGEVREVIEEDMVLKLDNAYVNVFRGSMRLNLGRYGNFSVLEEAPFDEVDLENNVSAQQVEYENRRSYGRDRGRSRRY